MDADSLNVINTALSRSRYKIHIYYSISISSLFYYKYIIETY